MELRAAALWMSRTPPQAEAEAEVADLLRCAVAGDVSAFEQVIVRFQRRVMTLAFRLLGTAEDAQDASQEVFLRVYRHLHRFDSGRLFEPWLVRMTVNVCRDLGRKRRYPNVILEADMLQSSGDPHSELSSEEQRQMVRRALAKLPEKERAAVVLRDLEGFSTAEVAGILGSSQTTVRSQISTARLKIKRAIERMI